MERESGYAGHLPHFLLELLEEQYGTEISEKIIAGYAKKRKVTLRANTLKASADEIGKALSDAGIAYRRMAWYEDAFVLPDATEGMLRELPVYQDGKIYLQSLSSMLPPLVLAPKAGEDILDMAAAPGGKTTQMAALSENKANITACEMSMVRAERLKYNVEKQGASCIYILQKDANRLDNFLKFDRILLDAPCSGSGVLDSSDKKTEKVFTKKLVEKSVKSQRALLQKAIDLLKKGQQMVYSTCSVLSCENEDVISHALSKGKVRLVPIETKQWQDFPLLPVKITGTVGIAPDEFFEGFFLAKLEKL